MWFLRENIVLPKIKHEATTRILLHYYLVKGAQVKLLFLHYNVNSLFFLTIHLDLNFKFDVITHFSLSFISMIIWNNHGIIEAVGNNLYVHISIVFDVIIFVH